MYKVGNFVLAKGYHDISGSTEKPFLIVNIEKVFIDLLEKEIGYQEDRITVKIKGKHYREEYWLKCQRDNGSFLNLPESLIIGEVSAVDQDLPW